MPPRKKLAPNHHSCKNKSSVPPTPPPLTPVSSESVTRDKRTKKTTAKAQQAIDDIQKAAKRMNKKAKHDKIKRKKASKKAEQEATREPSNVLIAELEKRLANHDALIESSLARTKELEATNSRLRTEILNSSAKNNSPDVQDITDGSFVKPTNRGRVGPATLMGLNTKDSDADRAIYDP